MLVKKLQAWYSSNRKNDFAQVDTTELGIKKTFPTLLPTK